MYNSDPFGGYDEWLEAPYVRAAREQEAFENYCEAKDLEPDDEAYEAFLAEEEVI